MRMENGKHSSTKNEVKRVYVFNSEIRITSTSTMMIPKVSELYSQVRSLCEKIKERNTPRQNVLFIHAEPCN